MKKKALIFAGLCAFSLCAWKAQAVNNEYVSIINMEDNVPTGYEIIDLQGALMFSVGPDDIIAGANDNSVYLHFSQNFGNVDIKIYSALGNLIYNCVVDTSMQQTIIIPISSNVSGTYTVVLTNVDGYAEGDFEHN
jgi:hypothetical protein